MNDVCTDRWCTVVNKHRWCRDVEPSTEPLVGLLDNTACAPMVEHLVPQDVALILTWDRYYKEERRSLLLLYICAILNV
jgi:hypothetical protein